MWRNANAGARFFLCRCFLVSNDGPVIRLTQASLQKIDTYLVLLTFRQENPNPKNSAKSFPKLTRLNELVALVHQDFGETLRVDNRQALRVEDIEVAEDAIVRDAFEPLVGAIAIGSILGIVKLTHEERGVLWHLNQRYCAWSSGAGLG